MLNRENKKLTPDKKAIEHYLASTKSIQVKIDQLGYKDESPEAYKAFLDGMENEKKKRGLTKSN